MNKNKIIVLLTVVVLFVTAVIVLIQVFSYHKVTLTVVDNVSVLIYETDNSTKNDIETINTSSSLSLKNGSYCGKPLGDIFDQNPICFTVNGKDISVVFDPNYSRSHLETLLSDQLATINTIITTKYSPVINDYSIQNGQLYGKGEWYGTTITQRVDQSGRGDVYRIILKKINDQWTIVAYPQIILSKFDYPNIPYSVLSDVNKLVGEF